MNLLMERTDVVCCDCDQPIPIGASYSQKLVAVGDRPGDDDNELVEVVCPAGFCRAAS